jgi:hypothetical protein
MEVVAKVDLTGLDVKSGGWSSQPFQNGAGATVVRFHGADKKVDIVFIQVHLKEDSCPWELEVERLAHIIFALKSRGYRHILVSGDFNDGGIDLPKKTLKDGKGNRFPDDPSTFGTVNDNDGHIDGWLWRKLAEVGMRDARNKEGFGIGGVSTYPYWPADVPCTGGVQTSFDHVFVTQELHDFIAHVEVIDFP